MARKFLKVFISLFVIVFLLIILMIIIFKEQVENQDIQISNLRNYNIMNIIENNMNTNNIIENENVVNTTNDNQITSTNDNNNDIIESDKNINEENIRNEKKLQQDNRISEKTENKDAEKNNVQDELVQKDMSRSNTEEVIQEDISQNDNVESQEKKGNTEIIETKDTYHELAYTETAKRNTTKEQQVIAWINDELSKNSNAIKWGYSVKAGTQEEAYDKTSGFSMYEERVRHRVSDSWGGEYRVYVEDIYIYNSTGTEQNLADTLVYVYSV